MLGRLAFPPKLVSVLCVIQVVTVIIGVALTGIFLKMEAVVWEGTSTYASAVAQFVRFHGILFLALPLLWSGWAILRNRRESRVVELDHAESLAGIALTAVMFFFFAWTTLHSIAMAAAYHRPMMSITVER